MFIGFPKSTVRKLASLGITFVAMQGYDYVLDNNGLCTVHSFREVLELVR